MGVGQDLGGATLAYVTRLVEGDIRQNITIFNPEEMANEFRVVKVEEPVIVFFPNQTCQVLSSKVAEQLGFMERPPVLNLEAVDNVESVAGKFKFAIDDADRRKYWKMMEESVISGCLSRGGYALPRENTYSSEPIFFNKQPRTKSKTMENV